jgi:hydroxymethylpyrimidine pyrophosphatase-like HAD family hydrolase
MKLIVLDIDGVLSAGDAQFFDLSLFKRLAMLNQLAKTDHQVPSVTLNTGRPSPYVEAVMQAIQGWQPALYEHGAGLYFPKTYQFQTTPLLTPDHKVALAEVVALLDVDIVQTGKAYWQPGKTICHTLLPIAPFSIQDIINDVHTLITDYTDIIVVSHTISSVDVHPKHVTKTAGLQWLAQVTQIDPSEMGGVGDSPSDADFLKLVGYPAAPANAVDDVKTVAHYVSDQSTTEALHDILDYWQLPS